MEIPSDTKAMTEKYSVDKGGICGQACLAVIEKSTIREVMFNWASLKMEFKGWSGWKQLREYLEKRGHKVKLRKKEIEFEEDAFYILRVQWLGEKDNKEKPFYGWGHWTEASAHTHFIVVNNGEVFCNEDGIFKVKFLNGYLAEEAVVTSVMEVQSSLNESSRNVGGKK